MENLNNNQHHWFTTSESNAFKHKTRTLSTVLPNGLKFYFRNFVDDLLYIYNNISSNDTINTLYFSQGLVQKKTNNPILIFTKTMH